MTFSRSVTCILGGLVFGVAGFVASAAAERRFEEARFSAEEVLEIIEFLQGQRDDVLKVACGGSSDVKVDHAFTTNTKYLVAEVSSIDNIVPRFKGDKPNQIEERQIACEKELAKAFEAELAAIKAAAEAACIAKIGEKQTSAKCDEDIEVGGKKCQKPINEDEHCVKTVEEKLSCKVPEGEKLKIKVTKSDYISFDMPQGRFRVKLDCAGTASIKAEGAGKVACSSCPR
jgi:hypothetical protein